MHIHWYKFEHWEDMPGVELTRNMIYIDRVCRCGKKKGKYLIA